MSKVGNRERAGFTLIELLVVVAIIGILIALLVPAISRARCVARNGAAAATLADLKRALTAYDGDYGTLPKNAQAKTCGSKALVDALRKKGPRFTPYYQFKDDDINSKGDFTSPHENQAYNYAYPAQPTGPDNKPHTGYDYYIWTWGCLNEPPDCDWEINNWTRS